MQSTEINLISTKTQLPEQLVAITKHVRRVGIGALLLSLGLGLFFGVGLTVMKLRVSQLTGEKNDLVARIRGASSKEGIYMVLLKQSAVAQKVLASVKPWDVAVDEITAIAPGGMLSSASINEKQELSLVAVAPSVEEAAGLVERISGLTAQNKIHSAVLESLEVGTDGKVKLVITFVPTL
ncbi:hypothetical protein HY086_06120 [Candidatus Gottesmanbacteria bacterium]|nr:hypothetical protein [Candidatus Gottesmanbacteria bacterium]